MNDTDFEVRLAASATAVAVPEGLDAHTRRILRSARTRRSRSLKVRLGVGIAGALVLGTGGVAAAANLGIDWTRTSKNTDGSACTWTWTVEPDSAVMSSLPKVQNRYLTRWALEINTERDILTGIDPDSLDADAITEYASELRQSIAEHPDSATFTKWTEAGIRQYAVSIVLSMEVERQMRDRGFTDLEAANVGSMTVTTSDGCWVGGNWSGNVHDN